MAVVVGKGIAGGRVGVRHREVDVLDGRRRKQRADGFEVLMLVADARIDHGPHDVAPARRERDLSGVRLHGGDRSVDQRVDHLIFPDAVDRAPWLDAPRIATARRRSTVSRRRRVRLLLSMLRLALWRFLRVAAG